MNSEDFYKWLAGMLAMLSAIAGGFGYHLTYSIQQTDTATATYVMPPTPTIDTFTPTPISVICTGTVTVERLNVRGCGNVTTLTNPANQCPIINSYAAGQNLTYLQSSVFVNNGLQWGQLSNNPALWVAITYVNARCP